MRSKTKNNFPISNIVLFVLYACDENGNSKVSKIAVQKLVYLAVAFAPEKNIILDFIKFRNETRGPYSKEIQNTLGKFLLTGFVEGYDYEKKIKATYINYKISEEGKRFVKKIIILEKEAENLWWISSICKLAIIYAKEEYNTKRIGLDKMVDFVYQEPTFLKNKIRKRGDNLYKKGLRKREINFKLIQGTANELILFSKEFLNKNNIIVNKDNERWVAELLLFNLFEFLYNKILLETR